MDLVLFEVAVFNCALSQVEINGLMESIGQILAVEAEDKFFIAWIRSTIPSIKSTKDNTSNLKIKSYSIVGSTIPISPIPALFSVLQKLDLTLNTCGARSGCLMFLTIGLVYF